MYEKFSKIPGSFLQFLGHFHQLIWTSPCTQWFAKTSTISIQKLVPESATKMIQIFFLSVTKYDWVIHNGVRRSCGLSNLRSKFRYPFLTQLTEYSEAYTFKGRFLKISRYSNSLVPKQQFVKRFYLRILENCVTGFVDFEVVSTCTQVFHPYPPHPVPSHNPPPHRPLQVMKSRVGICCRNARELKRQFARSFIHP